MKLVCMLAACLQSTSILWRFQQFRLYCF